MKNGVLVTVLRRIPEREDEEYHVKTNHTKLDARVRQKSSLKSTDRPLINFHDPYVTTTFTSLTCTTSDSKDYTPEIVTST